MRDEFSYSRRFRLSAGQPYTRPEERDMVMKMNANVMFRLVVDMLLGTVEVVAVTVAVAVAVIGGCNVSVVGSVVVLDK